ncbi:MAG TPA: hypothetical protein VJ698_00395 [Noviherbaspirillum sp.]|uniref:hypothetical protein n=1 Tax=Noviherbaspirillum sp. TaxID=1926288 RepID=UPI002B46AE6A|nr:hypothetical protein [Noviherbaspirillum sp.]HJV83904.1 hypothetical protein [Noviherbaspirillum sp.]
MSLTVQNSSGSNPVVTLFGQLGDGRFAGKRMHEDEVPYARYWDNAIDQAMVYIAPSDEQLDAILEALSEGKLAFSRLQDYGAAGGGTSDFPV